MQLHFDPTAMVDGVGGILGYVLLVIGLWPTLEKAGIPGWGALIPIWNTYLIFKLGGVSGWWMLLLLVPFLNLLVLLFVSFAVSEAFGHGFLLGFFGLWLFSPIGYWILGYGQSTYRRARFDAPSAQAS